MNTIEKKSYAVHKRIEPNLYERNGYFYTMHTVNGKQKWRSLHTTDLEKARRLMQADQAKSPNAHLAAELASLKALLTQLLDSPIKTPHYFRHWFITQTLLQGVPVRTLAGIIGHADGGALLLKTYRHLCDNAAN